MSYILAVFCGVGEAVMQTKALNDTDIRGYSYLVCRFFHTGRHSILLKFDGEERGKSIVVIVDAFECSTASA